MTIPDYQTIMLPLLRLLGDTKIHEINDCVEELANYFKLSEEEKKAMLPSGRQATFANRVRWAKTYLKEAGLIEAAGTGHFQI